MAESLHILLGTSACLQWLCHSGERTVARGPLVYVAFLLSRVFETGLVGLAKTQLFFFLCLIGIDEYHCFPTRYTCIYVLMQK